MLTITHVSEQFRNVGTRNAAIKYVRVKIEKSGEARKKKRFVRN